MTGVAQGVHPERSAPPWRVRRGVVAALVVAALALAAGGARPGEAAPATGRYAFLQSTDGGFSYRIVTVDGAGRRRVRITAKRAVGRPAFSPDGSRLAFAGPLTDDSDGRYALYVVNVDGTGLRRLTRPTFADFDPAWSPDGRLLAYTHDTRGNLGPSCCLLRVVRVDTGRRRTVRGTRGGSQPSWSPDGRHLVYASRGGLRRVAVDGRRSRRLLAGDVSDPAWSPDGRHIAYVEHLSPTRSRLRVLPSRGGSPAVRVDRSGQVESPVWEADARGLAFVSYRGQGDEGRTASSVWRSAGPGGPLARLFDPGREIHGLTHTAGAPVVRDLPVAGDWNGDGRATAGLVGSAGGRLRWRLTDRHDPPAVTRDLLYGSPGRYDVPVAGDWDGNGTVTPGVVRPAGGRLRWLLSNSADRPRVAIRFTFGSASRYDVPVVGDWDGDGRTTVGVVRPVGRELRWLLLNRNASTRVARRFSFGSVAAPDVPVTGDWDGDGRTTAGLVRYQPDGLLWRQTDDPQAGSTARAFRFGSTRRHDRPVTGDWDGDGSDTVGFVRPEVRRLHWFLTDANAAGAATRRFTFGRG